VEESTMIDKLEWTMNLISFTNSNQYTHQNSFRFLSYIKEQQTIKQLFHN